MKLKIVWLFLAAFSTVVSAGVPDIKEVVRKAQERAVYLRTLHTGASGTIVGKDLVLTTFHNLEAASPVWIGGVLAKVVHTSTVDDLALLSVDTDNFPPLEYGKVEVADNIFYAGFPLHEPSVVFGQVAWVDDNYIKTSAIPQPAISGSGVWTLEGKFVGLMFYMTGTRELGGGWFSKAIPGHKVKKFLREFWDKDKKYLPFPLPSEKEEGNARIEMRGFQGIL